MHVLHQRDFHSIQDRALWMFDDTSFDDEIRRSVSRLRLTVNYDACLTQCLFHGTLDPGCGEPACLKVLANRVNINKDSTQATQGFFRVGLRVRTQSGTERKHGEHKNLSNQFPPLARCGI